MYYSNDENGNIIFSDDVSILPEEYQDLYPESASDIFSEEDAPGIDLSYPSVSSGDASVSAPTYIIDYSEPIDYDYLYELLAAIPQYNLYPNATAVNIFTSVLNHLDGNYGYVITAGSSAQDTYLYFSEDYDVSGNLITLHAPVTQCRYYYYTQNSTTNYTYNVLVINDDETVSLSNRLIYTNLKDGYPDVIPYKQKESYSASLALFFMLAALAVFVFRRSIK